MHVAGGTRRDTGRLRGRMAAVLRPAASNDDGLRIKNMVGNDPPRGYL